MSGASVLSVHGTFKRCLRDGAPLFAACHLSGNVHHVQCRCAVALTHAPLAQRSTLGLWCLAQAFIPGCRTLLSRSSCYQVLTFCARGLLQGLRPPLLTTLQANMGHDHARHTWPRPCASDLALPSKMILKAK